MKIKINGLFDFAYRFLLIFTNILSHCGRWPFQTKERRYTHTHTHTHTHRKVNRKHVWPPEGPRCRFPKEESLILFFFWFFFFIKEKSRWTFFLPNVWNSFFSLFCYLSQSSTRVVSGVKADVWPMEWPVGKFFIIIYWKLFRHVLRPYRVVKLLSKSYLLFL